ncbi:MAG: hypothetical protein CL886_04840 [Dehalococcoidia bacterium]|nr:hypothetical protein [Dehalococcoidia bacterium]|tara:strand:+ start:14876 stop:15889 length:1014 start_codon:yes stop_codon:yes gene_type:complete
MLEGNFRINILDQSPANQFESGRQAISHTIELAQKAESWGYHRFWVSEHHNSPRHMGSSPEVLVSHLLAKTEHIKIGSGGVMLQHYSPYKVAENFNLLSSISPGRVDLGVGRGPGGLPITTKALQTSEEPGINSFEAKLTALQQFIIDNIPPDNPLYGIQAKPIPDVPADLFLLGTTVSSAVLAAQMELPYVFAAFLNNDRDIMAAAIENYSDCYKRDTVREPNLMLALPIIVADSEKTAKDYASDIVIVRVTLESGRTFTVFSIESAEDLGKQSGEKFTYELQPGSVIHGSKKTVKQKIDEIRYLYNVNEIFAVTAINDFENRLRSYELLSEICWA